MLRPFFCAFGACYARKNRCAFGVLCPEEPLCFLRALPGVAQTVAEIRVTVYGSSEKC